MRGGGRVAGVHVRRRGPCTSSERATDLAGTAALEAAARAARTSGGVVHARRCHARPLAERRAPAAGESACTAIVRVVPDVHAVSAAALKAESTRRGAASVPGNARFANLRDVHRCIEDRRWAPRSGARGREFGDRAEHRGCWGNHPAWSGPLRGKGRQEDHAVAHLGLRTPLGGIEYTSASILRPLLPDGYFLPVEVLVRRPPALTFLVAAFVACGSNGSTGALPDGAPQSAGDDASTQNAIDAAQQDGDAGAAGPDDAGAKGDANAGLAPSPDAGDAAPPDGGVCTGSCSPGGGDAASPDSGVCPASCSTPTDCNACPQKAFGGWSCNNGVCQFMG